MNGFDFKVGDQVLFGRPNGEQTCGEIVKVNRKTYKVKTLEGRARYDKAGRIWNVSKSLVRPVDAKKPAASAPRFRLVPVAPPIPNFSPGDRVAFNGLTGVVKRVNRKTMTVTADDGRGYYVPYSLAQLVEGK